MFVAAPTPPTPSPHTLTQVWKFESDSTLADALSGNLGQWPEDIEEIMLKKVDESQPVEKREASVSVGV